MPILAQDVDVFLDKFAPGDLIAFFAITVVFTTGLLVVITICVTTMISSIRIASINAKLAEKLAQQGMSPDEIQQVINHSSKRPDPGKLPRPWRRAEPLQSETPGKPASFGSA